MSKILGVVAYVCIVLFLLFVLASGVLYVIYW